MYSVWCERAHRIAPHQVDRINWCTEDQRGHAWSEQYGRVTLFCLYQLALNNVFASNKYADRSTLYRLIATSVYHVAEEKIVAQRLTFTRTKSCRKCDYVIEIYIHEHRLNCVQLKRRCGDVLKKSCDLTKFWEIQI